MSEPIPEQPDADTQPEPRDPWHHEHVRTEGETAVDDALGTGDDPSS